MNFFAEQRTDRMVHGFLVPASWFQSVNPGVLILAGPLFAALWTGLGRRQRDPGTPAKMAVAMVLLGLGFVFMVAGGRASDHGALVSPWWLVGAYSFHTFGELCLSPIGLSLVTKLTPAKFAAVTMGFWFLSTGIAELLAGQVAATTDRIARGELFHLFGGQADFYFIFVVLSAVTALVLFACGPALGRRMHGLDR
jgi:POT family proton-dependent oligopeptide transporter